MTTKTKKEKWYTPSIRGPQTDGRKEWPVGLRVVVSGGNLYTMGTVYAHYDDSQYVGIPNVLTDEGVWWCAYDVSLRLPTKKYDTALMKEHKDKAICIRRIPNKKLHFCGRPALPGGFCDKHKKTPIHIAVVRAINLINWGYFPKCGRNAKVGDRMNHTRRHATCTVCLGKGKKP